MTTKRIYRHTYTYRSEEHDRRNRAIVLSFDSQPIVRSLELTNNPYVPVSLGYFCTSQRMKIVIHFTLRESEDDNNFLRLKISGLGDAVKIQTEKRLSTGNLKYCAVCHSIFNPSAHKNSRLCCKCQERWNLCDECGRVCRINGYCDRCYTRCYNCSEIVRRSECEQISEAIVCRSCYESDSIRRYCGRCDQVIFTWDWNDHRENCSRIRIESHGYKPIPIFFKIYPERVKRFFGLEIEAECYKSSADDTVNEWIEEYILSSELKNLVYLKEDSSLNDGIEFVTHPMSRRFITDKFYPLWQDFSRLLIHNAGMRSHDTETCGLHIHISRDSALVRDWARFSTFINTQSLTDKICRRPAGSYCHKKQIYPYDDESTVEHKMSHNGNMGRYETVNFENDKTVEVRQFRGTLNPDTLLASVIFCDELLHFVQPLTVSAIRFNDLTGDFMTFVNTRKNNLPLVRYLELIKNNNYAREDR